MMKRFPYQLVYLIEPDAIYIIALAHLKRQPNYWLYRLSEPGRD